jgi:L-alanine-DL-glutamate epimerase-like enolase superfamily enzyme
MEHKLRRLSRRAVLELISAGVAGCALSDGAWAVSPPGKSRIVRIDQFPVRYPMRGRFKFFEGPEGSPTGRPAVLVRISDDDGMVGWGESVPIPKWSDETLETVASTIERYLAPELIGRDPADIAGAHAVMNRAIAPAFSTGQPIAKAGIDIALHDLVSRRAGLNVTALWGRVSGQPLTLSWTVNPRSLDEIDALVESGRTLGYQALARQRALPILMDEGIISTEELVEFIRLGMLDGVAMKPARGASHPARRQIELVQDTGLMWLASGLTDPDVSLAATLALFSSFGQSRPCALNGPQFLAHSVIESPFTPRNGQLVPATGPGLGIVVNEAKLRAIGVSAAAAPVTGD